MSNTEFIVITAEVFDCAISSNGGFSSAQLALLGIPFPPPKGWKQQLLGKPAPRESVEKFIALKDRHLQKRSEGEEDFGSSKMQSTINPENSSERKPSEVTDIPWILAKRKAGIYPAATAESGKWLVFVPIAQVDEIWARIKQATKDGRLGQASKVATAAPNPHTVDPDKKVICVYTYSGDDEADVWRVREELKKLGITWTLSYKSDRATRSGQYSTSGHTKVSKYRG